MRWVALLLVLAGVLACSSSPDIRGRNADARAWAESERRDEEARKRHGALPRSRSSVASSATSSAPAKSAPSPAPGAGPAAPAPPASR